jgi:hypothetical protein
MEFVELLDVSKRARGEARCFPPRAAGIPSSVAKDDAGGMEPHLQLRRTVRLRVPSDRLDDARRLLEIGKK